VEGETYVLRAVKRKFGIFGQNDTFFMTPVLLQRMSCLHKNTEDFCLHRNTIIIPGSTLIFAIRGFIKHAILSCCKNSILNVFDHDSKVTMETIDRHSLSFMTVRLQRIL